VELAQQDMESQCHGKLTTDNLIHVDSSRVQPLVEMIPSQGFFLCITMEPPHPGLTLHITPQKDLKYKGRIWSPALPYA